MGVVESRPMSYATTQLQPKVGHSSDSTTPIPFIWNNFFTPTCNHHHLSKLLCILMESLDATRCVRLVRQHDRPVLVAYASRTTQHLRQQPSG